MHRRTFLSLPLVTSIATTAHADSASRDLASYYERHMALATDGTAWAWSGRGVPQRQRGGVRQVGVSKDHCFALLTDGTLLAWTELPERALTLKRSVASFAAGHSGWFAIDDAGVLWQASGLDGTPQRVAEGVAAACIGDSADYYATRDGALFVKGLAHRGQYGDGKLTESPVYVQTAADVVAVKAHTGHAIHLRRDGAVMGTGGNRFGPLSSHGLGDKADRWGKLFDGAVAIATGSRHSLAIRADASLWGWGEGFGIAPAPLMADVASVAAGDTATIARTRDGTLWQWDGGGKPRRVAPPGASIR